MTRSSIRNGFDAGTAREPLAARFYDVTHHVPLSQHAVPRNRALGAAALGYRVEEPIDYGIVISGSLTQPARPYAVLLHAAAAATSSG